MWTSLLLLIQRYKTKVELKKEEKKQEVQTSLEKTKDSKKVKKLKLKLKWYNLGLVATILIPIIAFILAAVMAYYILMMFTGIFGFNILNRQEDPTESDGPDSEWSWNNPDIGGDNIGDTTTGGIYPKDPKIRQSAMFIELVEKSCEIVNSERGQMVITPTTIFGALLRESGGRSYNEVMSDVKKNLYGQLFYANPICGGGAGCLWLKAGTSHFVGGTTSGNSDNGDPHTMEPVTDKNTYEAHGGGPHALGYGQFEVTSVPGTLVRAFPVGDYKDTVYNNATDRYKMDTKLNFIRPNIGFIPDVVLSMANRLGGAFGDKSQVTWNALNNEAWFMSLSEYDKAYCRGVIKGLGYMAGENSVDELSLKIVRVALKTCWALREDGHMSRIQDIIPFGDKQYGYTLTQTNYNFNSMQFYRSGNAGFPDIFNKIMNDSSLGSNTQAASAELKILMGSVSRTGYAKYTDKIIDGIPLVMGFESIAETVYHGMVEVVKNAEKDVPSGGGISIAGSNFLEPVGSGKFQNPTKSEYYMPGANGVWFAQGGVKGGGTVFGGKVPSYTNTMQAQPFYGGNYTATGCPAYACAMAMSNLTGMVILPDGLPGTTVAKQPWSVGSHNMVTKGLGFTTIPDNVFKSFNKTITANGAGYTLAHKQLTKAQIQEKGTSIYDWLDNGAMIIIRVVRYGSKAKSGGNHFATIVGYDKSAKSGDWYDLRVMNSVLGNNEYQGLTEGNGQLMPAEKLAEKDGLSYYLRNYPNYAALVVWRTDLTKSLPNL